MTNEQRLTEAERIATAVAERVKTKKEGRGCHRCRHLYGAQPGYNYVGKGDFCRNPVVREAKGHVQGEGKYSDDRAMRAREARLESGLCGPDGLFWQANLTASMQDFIRNIGS